MGKDHIKMSKLRTEYHSYHNFKILGYVDLTCCVIIIISNVLVILVFARGNTKSPMKTIFIHMAIAESLVAVVYAPRAFQQLIRATLCSIPEHRTKEWEQIALYSFEFAHLFRTVTVWMTCMLGVWRYIAVLHPLKVRIWCSMKITRRFIVLGYLFGVVLAIPLLFCLAIGEVDILVDENGCFTTNSTTNHNVTIYEFQLPLENYPFWYNLVFLGFAALKIIPSLVFAVISYKLINAIIEAKKIHRNIAHNSYERNRTTIILLFILLLFVIGEVPNGIGVLLNVLAGPEYFWNRYYYDVEIFNCLTHICESFNLVIYYVISDQFRKTFKELFTRIKTDYSHLTRATSTSRFTGVTLLSVNKLNHDANLPSSSNNRDYNSIQCDPEVT